jgi:uncharacterized protein YjiK
MIKSIGFEYKEVTSNSFEGLSIREDDEKIIFAQEGMTLKILEYRLTDARPALCPMSNSPL